MISESQLWRLEGGPDIEAEKEGKKEEIGSKDRKAPELVTARKDRGRESNPLKDPSPENCYSPAKILHCVFPRNF